MKRNVLICLLALTLSSPLAIAQSDIPAAFQNSVKLNTLGMVLKNVSFLYERSLNEHWSLQAGTSYRWGGDFPKALALGNVIVDSESTGIRGYSFTPELRYYFNVCDCASTLSGLYTGLYGRFTKYFGDLTVTAWTGSEYVDVATAGDFREVGLGLQIGYQLVIKKRFLVDLMFAGPRLSTNKIKFSLDSDYVEEVIPVIEEEINEKLEWLGMDPISIDPSADFEAKFGFRYFRYAIGIGILF